MIVSTYWQILAALPVISLLMIWVFLTYLPAYKECQRIESITKSPMLNQVAERSSGSSTIKAFGTSKVFESKFFRCLNDNVLTYLFLYGTLNWSSMRILIIQLMLNVASTSICIVFRQQLNPIMIGLTFQYII